MCEERRKIVKENKYGKALILFDASDLLERLEALLEGAVLLAEKGDNDKSLALVYMALDLVKTQ